MDNMMTSDKSFEALRELQSVFVDLNILCDAESRMTLTAGKSVTKLFMHWQRPLRP